VLAQLPYQWAFGIPGDFQINILGTLSLGLLAIAVSRRWPRPAGLWCGLLLFGWLLQQQLATTWFSYGFAGPLVVLACYRLLAASSQPGARLPAYWALFLLGLLLLNFRPDSLHVETWYPALERSLPAMIATLGSLPLVLFVLHSEKENRGQRPGLLVRHAYYAYYPAHLLVLLYLWHLGLG
jgi:hypothetical protein